MSSVVPILVHESQFPQNIRRDLLESLRTRKVNHKFHYESVKQAHQWLALHQKYSPSRRDPDCTRVYDEAFKAAAGNLGTRDVHLIGIGSGGGQKDTRLLGYLRNKRRTTFYTPCDVSNSMVLTALKIACGKVHGRQPVVRSSRCSLLVCDIANTADLPTVLDGIEVSALAARETGFRPRAVHGTRRLRHAPAARILTFFGMIPNFQPALILPRLASMIRRGDILLFSANLAPGLHYARGVGKIVSQYDNPLTREWLMTFLLDLGIGRQDGELRFSIVTDNSNSPLRLKRIQADFHFTRRRAISLDDVEFVFAVGASIRVFFSYRYTPSLIHAVLQRHGLAVRQQWITASEQEGVFLVEKAT
jgi:hypothetical protein